MESAINWEGFISKVKPKPNFQVKSSDEERIRDGRYC